jgi:hypothetical protein
VPDGRRGLLPVRETVFRGGERRRGRPVPIHDHHDRKVNLAAEELERRLPSWIHEYRDGEDSSRERTARGDGSCPIEIIPDGVELVRAGTASGAVIVEEREHERGALAEPPEVDRRRPLGVAKRRRGDDSAFAQIRPGKDHR